MLTKKKFLHSCSERNHQKKRLGHRNLPKMMSQEDYLVCVNLLNLLCSPRLIPGSTDVMYEMSQNDVQAFAKICYSSAPHIRARLHGIGFKWDRIHWVPIRFLRGVYKGLDPELFALTRDRIRLDFMNS